MSPYAKSAMTWLCVIGVVVVFFAFRYALVQGVFSSVTPTIPGACRAIAAGLKGPEDFEIDTPNNAILVSAINRGAATPFSDPHDGLYFLKLDDPAAPPVKLTGTPLDFHPHGISLFRDEAGHETLMVIDHKPSGKQMIEVYSLTYDGGMAKLNQQSVMQSGAMVSPNDLTAVASDKFFVTNDHVTTNMPGRFAEDYLLWPHADVLAYNGQGFRIAAQRIATPNGALSKGQMLYVTATNERRVIAFSQDIIGDLTQIGSLSLPARLDNISLDQQGNLIIAGQTRPGTAQVFRVHLGPDGAPVSYETLFSDDGHLLNGASSAAISGDHLFIGSPRDSKMLECDIK